MPALKLSAGYTVVDGKGHGQLTDADKREWPLLDLTDKIALCDLALKQHPNVPWAGQRDAGVVALLGSFGKRDSEICGLGYNDFKVTDKELLVSFEIRKTGKAYTKRCPTCKRQYIEKRFFCTEEHGGALEPIPNLQPRKRLVRQKARELDYPLTHYITDWLNVVKKYNPKGENLSVFPTIKNYLKPMFGVGDHMTRMNVTVGIIYPLVEDYKQRYAELHEGKVLWMWPHLFRHSLASELKTKKGYTDEQLQDFFDWARAETATHYTRLGQSDVGREVSQMKDV